MPTADHTAWIKVEYAADDEQETKMLETWWTRRSDERVYLVLNKQSDDIPSRHFAVTSRVQRHETATQSDTTAY